MVLIYGFAVFSMFFGSGNLVFPISIGAGSHDLLASACGLTISAILVPMMGLISVALFKGTLMDYFSHLGHRMSFLLIGLMMLLLGPFGVLPRSILVASGGIGLLFPKLPSGIICAVVAFLGYLLARSEHTISLIGKVFTPVILFGLGALMVGLLSPQSAPADTPYQGFLFALDQGYQTMDLIASFFFASALTTAFKEKNPEGFPRQLILSIILGFFCLLLVYVLMLILSANYKADLIGIAAEQRIVKIAQLVLGDYALLTASMIIAIACITTLAVLLKEFAKYVQHEFSPAVPMKAIMMVTVFLSYCGSFVGFGALASYIGHFLAVFYPALMAYVLMRLMGVQSSKYHRLVFYAVSCANFLLMISPLLGLGLNLK